ncbi:hypothetical protein [Synechococcus sp. TAK9802]|uniref:hypothetical protein n=1 Tax=Synechococcus sp. TAK9802 TaxID=1442558 RepID=UPI001648D665|nr:hypothetical protein [Synechococcus sp. TAK9802]
MNYTSLKNLFKNKSCYCIGTGPSLDLIDTSLIKDSIVLLLNSAYHLYNSLDSSNIVFWFSIDSGFISRNITLIPSSLPAILIPNGFRYYGTYKNLTRPTDIIFFPTLSLRRGHRFGFPNLRPKLVSLVDVNNGNYFKSFRTPIFPHTVMLNAIALASKFQSSSIIAIGFDCPSAKAEKNYTYSSLINSFINSNNRGFNTDQIESYLQALNSYSESIGSKIFNWSPLSTLKSIHKVQTIDW